MTETMSIKNLTEAGWKDVCDDNNKDNLFALPVTS